MGKKLRVEFEKRVGAAYLLGAMGEEPPAENSIERAAWLDGVNIERSQISPKPSGREAREHHVRKLVRWYGETSRIGWTHYTFNPWWGCVKVSEGCKNCYAESLSSRYGHDVWGRKKPRRLIKHWESKLRKWQKLAEDPMWRHEFGLVPRERPRIFCGSMCDFAEDREDLRGHQEALFDLIRANDWATWLLLTKRPQNIPYLLPADWGEGWEHVWPGTSIESGSFDVIDAELQAPVIERATRLLAIPAAVHWFSYEPALGALAEDLRPYLEGIVCPACEGDCEVIDGREAYRHPIFSGPEIYPCDTCRGRGEVALDWGVYGGESGSGWRPEGTAEDPKIWARKMRDACRETGTAFFHKQSSGPRNETGVELDGEIIHEYPDAGRFLE